MLWPTMLEGDSPFDSNDTRKNRERGLIREVGRPVVGHCAR